MDCEAYHALPRAGGVLDQPAGLLKRMRATMNVYRAYQAYQHDGMKAGEMAKWRSENSDIWEIVIDIERLRNG